MRDWGRYWNKGGKIRCGYLSSHYLWLKTLKWPKTWSNGTNSNPSRLDLNWHESCAGAPEEINSGRITQPISRPKWNENSWFWFDPFENFATTTVCCWYWVDRLDCGFHDTFLWGDIYHQWVDTNSTLGVLELFSHHVGLLFDAGWTDLFDAAFDGEKLEVCLAINVCWPLFQFKDQKQLASALKNSWKQ